MVATHQIETTGTRWCDGNHKAKHSPSLPPPSFPATFPGLAEGARYKSCSSSEEMSVGVDLAVVSWFGKGCHQILAQDFWGPCLGKDCGEVQETFAAKSQLALCPTLSRPKGKQSHVGADIHDQRCLGSEIVYETGNSNGVDTDEQDIADRSDRRGVTNQTRWSSHPKWVLTRSLATILQIMRQKHVWP